jgi:hypothetical protein
MEEKHIKQIMEVVEKALRENTVHINYTDKLSPNFELIGRNAHPKSRGKIILIETGTHEVDIKIINGEVVIKNV